MPYVRSRSRPLSALWFLLVFAIVAVAVLTALLDSTDTPANFSPDYAAILLVFPGIIVLLTLLLLGLLFILRHLRDDEQALYSRSRPSLWSRLIKAR